MVRFLKYVGISAAVLIGLLIVLLLAFIVIPAEKYKPLLSYGIGVATGRELLIEGRLDIKLGRTLAIEASDVKFANTAWGSRPFMASVDRLAGEVALLPLLKGILDVSLSVDRPDVLLEINASGQGNWEIGAAGSAENEVAEKKAETESNASGSPELLLRPVIRKVDIKNTHFAFINHNDDTPMTLSNGTLQVETVGKRLAIDFGISFNDIPLAFAGSFDNARFLADNKVTDVQIDGNAGKVKLAVTGSVGPVAPAFDLDLALAMKADSLKAFSSKAVRDLPNLGPLSMTARLKGRQGKYSVEDMQAILRDDILSIDVKGSVEDVLKIQGVDATADLKIRSMDFLSKIAGTDLSSLGSLRASAVVSSDDGRFEIKDFKADLSGQHITADIAGSLKDVQKLTGIDANFKVALDSLDSLDSLAKRKLPASEPIELAGKFSGAGGLKEPVAIDVSLKSDGVDANVDGRIVDLLTAAAVDLAFDIKAESLAKAGKLTGLQLQSSDPLSITGQFLTDEKAYRLSGLHLSAGKLEAKGDVAYQPHPPAADRPRVNGRLQIGELDISNRMLANKEPAPESADKIEPPVQQHENQNEVVKEKVFPTQPLPFDLLRSVDVDVELVLEKLIAPQWEVKDFSARIDLENGLLRLAPVTAGLGNGSLSGAIMLDTGKSPTELDINLKVQAATLRNLSGNINFLADLAGSGDSVATIMAGLNGLVELDIKNLTLNNKLMADFAAGFFNFLNPFGKGEETTQVICSVVLFKIKDGIADARRKIVAQMEDVTWLGGGEINLKTEEISLGISPRSRELLDIDMGELASIGYLGGTLAQPKIAVDPKDIAIKYGKYTAAMFTGGLSLIADQLWRKFQANQDVCGRILQMVEAED